MKKIIIHLIAGLLAYTVIAAPERPTVGMHKLVIAEEGTRSRLVSVPFLRMSLAYGRLDGIQVASGSESAPRLLDAQGAFAKLASGGTYILRITGGASDGAWFIIDEVGGDGLSATVREDGLVGYVGDLSGNESFAIHKLFSLNELFPPALEDFPGSAIDLMAMQVHFYDGKRFARYWLSDGTLTEHVGWTYAENGVLKNGGDLAILPGTSFLVVYPGATSRQEIQINGMVPGGGLTVPMYPGYNYVSLKYTQNLAGGLPAISDYLNILGLKESGFKGGTSAEDSDLIYALNNKNGALIDGYYYDESADKFIPVDDQSMEIQLGDVGPGRGFVVFNGGETYLWKSNL